MRNLYYWRTETSSEIHLITCIKSTDQLLKMTQSSPSPNMNHYSVYILAFYAHMKTSLKTMLFTYLYIVISIVTPFFVLRYIAYHPWTVQLLWIPIFDFCKPPGTLRELTEIELERIAILYCGLVVYNCFNQSLTGLCDRDGKYILT